MQPFPSCWLAVLTGLVLTASAGSASSPAAPARYGTIELIRDRWGIPHVFSETDDGALFGLGYATAEERGFQMHYTLRLIQGRAAELLGERRLAARPRETTLDHDRRMRTMGFYRAAQRVAEALDAETRTLLAAYAEGVNAWFARHPQDRQERFAQFGLTPEPWTPADCLAVWWHLGQFFATDGTRELLQYRTLTEPPRDRSGRPGDRSQGRALPPTSSPAWLDDSAAVVRREDVSDAWLERVRAFFQQPGGTGIGSDLGETDGPRFSHAWVVGGRKTPTGSAVLISDPQTPVRFPALWQEFHVSGETFNARGIGVPGSPGLLIGWNAHVAWGATALGADQADLFRLRTAPERPDQYLFDGAWRPMTVRREVIRVRGGAPVELTVRETHWGPVVTAFAFAGPQDPEVALKRVPLCVTHRETIQALFGLMRATNLAAFTRALAGWDFPSVHLVFGDRAGRIGYWLGAAIPVRSALDPHGGRAALDGTSSAWDWRGFVPHELLPHVLDPPRGWLASANHRAIGSFYPDTLGLSTGSAGHTVRSWRLYERLEGPTSFRPEEVLAVHFDAVNPARRDLVKAGLHLRDRLRQPLSAEAREALAQLEPWFRQGAQSDWRLPGAALAAEISTFFRFVNTPLALEHGGGETGLTHFLRALSRRIEADPAAPLEEAERAFLDQALAGAWRSARAKYGEDPAHWNTAARELARSGRLSWMESLDGIGPLDPTLQLPLPPLDCVDGGTIKSQAAQSYTQYVPLHDVDAALSLLPPGHSDRPEAPEHRSTWELWAQGQLHPAPLTRPAVERIAVRRQRLVASSTPAQASPTGATETLPFQPVASPAASAVGLTLAREGPWLVILGENLPGGPIRINYLEAYCRAGSTDADWVAHTVIPHTNELVYLSADRRVLRLRDTLADGLVVEHTITASADEVDFRLVAHNPTPRRSEAHWAQPCVRVGRFTGFSDRLDEGDLNDYLPQCFVFLDGRLTRMPTPGWATQARYTPGQVWRPAHVPASDVNPRPVNALTPSHGLIGCFSRDESRVLALAWEPYQELFQGVARCLHSDFRLGGLAPGETRHLRGKLYLVPSDIPALLQRYAKDFPEHQNPGQRY